MEAIRLVRGRAMDLVLDANKSREQRLNACDCLIVSLLCYIDSKEFELLLPGSEAEKPWFYNLSERGELATATPETEDAESAILHRCQYEIL